MLGRARSTGRYPSEDMPNFSDRCLASASRFRGVLGHTFGLPVDPPVNSMKKGLIRIKENVGNPRVLIQHGRRDDLRAGGKIAGTIRKQKRRRQGFKTSIKALSGEGIREERDGVRRPEKPSVLRRGALYSSVQRQARARSFPPGG